MRRKIKFRAWDTIANKMGTVATWNGMTYGADSEFNYLGLEDGHYAVVKYSNAVIMQFTGLHDKNGKEIYEGDIVKMHQFLFDGSEVEKEGTGVVGYSTTAFTFSKIRHPFVTQHTGLAPDEAEIPIHDFYGLHDDSFEVIGNIYENPELLKV